MASFLPSMFWFILTGILAIFALLVLICWCETHEPTTGDNILLICMTISPIITLAFSFRAPDKVQTIVIEDEKLQAMIDKSVETRIKELSVKYKYELISQ